MTPLILAIAHDVSPSRALRALMSHVSDEKLSTDIVLLDGSHCAPSRSSLCAKIDAAQFVVIGMSSSAKDAYVELQAVSHCVATGKRFALFADTFRSYARPFFGEGRSRASLMFVVSETEVAMARSLCPRACVLPVGNPLWAPYFEPSDPGRARALMHALDHEYVILVPGTKDAQQNETVLCGTVRAARSFSNRRIVFTKHPGDHTETAVYESLIAAISTDDARVTFSRTATDELIPGIDLMINGSASLVHAIARRKPVIEFYDSYAQARLAASSGSRYGHFFGSGAVIDVYSDDWQDLVPAMQTLADDPARLCEAQSHVLPVTDRSGSLTAMFRAISSFL